MFSDIKKTLSKEQFTQFRDIVYKESGIFFLDSKQYLLESRLSQRLAELNFESFDDYYYFLTYDPKRASELNVLLDIVTINETSFFRHLPQIEVFEGEILSSLLAKKPNERLRVWSAACSSGEEPYTLSMVLLEKNLRNFDILASDLSDRVLATARAGVYGLNSVRSTPEKYLEKYFTRTGANQFAVSQEVKRNVRFSRTNLYDINQMRLIKGMDVVFLRNVLIYFDEKVKKDVISHIYTSMNPGGYLILGHSESLYNISRSFNLVHFGKNIVYQK